MPKATINLHHVSAYLAQLCSKLKKHMLYHMQVQNQSTSQVFSSASSIKVVVRKLVDARASHHRVAMLPEVLVLTLEVKASAKCLQDLHRSAGRASSIQRVRSIPMASS